MTLYQPCWKNDPFRFTFHEKYDLLMNSGMFSINNYLLDHGENNEGSPLGNSREGRAGLPKSSKQSLESYK